MPVLNTNVDILLRVRDEAAAKLREVAAETGGLVGTFQRLTAGIGIWGGLATSIGTAAAAAVSASSQIANLVEQLDRATGITSIGIGPLQAMFKIIRDGGGDTDALVKALGFFKRQIAENNPLLAQLGITQGSVEERFLSLARTLARSNDEFKVARATQELLGKTGEQLIPHFDDLASKTGDVQRSMQATGEAIGGKLLPQYRALDQANDKLKGDWKGTWNELTGASVGPSTLIVRSIDGILNAFRGLGRSVHESTVGIMDDLAKAQKSTETFEDRLARARAEAQRRGGKVQIGVPTLQPVEVSAARKRDPLSDVNFDTKSHAKTPAVFGPGSPSGIQAFIENMIKEAAEKRQRDLAEMLQRNIILPPMFGGGMLPIPGGPGRLGGATHVDPFKEIVDAWNKAVDAILSSTSILKDSLGAVWDGLREGVSNVFVGMLNGSQTFASGVQAVFHSLGNSILNYLGTLIAAKVFQLFLKLVSFALDIPSAAFGPIGVPFDPSVLAMAGPGAAASSFASGSAGLGTGGGNTIIIQTISAKDVLQSLLSPRGVMRAANDRILEVAAAS